MKRTIAILLAVLLMLGAFAGCGGNNGGSGGSGAEGTYVLKSMMGMDVAAYAKMVGISENDAASMFKVVLKSGGKAEFTTDDDTSQLDWSQNGNKITLSGGGETMDLTLNGNELTMSIEGMDIVLVKQ